MAHGLRLEFGEAEQKEGKSYGTTNFSCVKK
jgi:hypothetical protein